MKFLLMGVANLDASSLVRRVGMVEGMIELSTNLEDGKMCEIHKRWNMLERIGWIHN